MELEKIKSIIAVVECTECKGIGLVDPKPKLCPSCQGQGTMKKYMSFVEMIQLATMLKKQILESK